MDYVARVCMQLFDKKLKSKLQALMISYSLVKRYMDDSRMLLPPIKPGWRADEQGIRYCKAWEKEDMELSGAEATRRVLLETMNGVESFLNFTGEIGEDFEGGGYPPWTPT